MVRRQIKAPLRLVLVLEDVWVKVAIGAYRLAAERRGASLFLHIKVTDRLQAQARKLKTIHEVTGRSFRELMDRAFSFYSEEWCQRTFRRAWPPPTLVLGPKCLSRVARSFPRKEKPSTANYKEAAIVLWNTALGMTHRKTAIRNVMEGLWPPDQKIREALKSMIEKGEI